jgi:hypothetical protein
LTFWWEKCVKPFFGNLLIIFHEQISKFQFEARISAGTPIVVSSGKPTCDGANRAMADGGKLFIININSPKDGYR